MDNKKLSFWQQKGTKIFIFFDFSSRIKPLFDKTQISGHEPQNEIACDQNVEVTVNISAVSGHAVLLSQAYKVEFEDTYMFQV